MLCPAAQRQAWEVITIDWSEFAAGRELHDSPIHGPAKNSIHNKPKNLVQFELHHDGDGHFAPAPRPANSAEERRI